ncbi:MAG: class I tRNA ligase family protein [Inhella sp.]
MPTPGFNHFSAADRWIVSRLQRVEAEVAKAFEDYRLDLVANSASSGTSTAIGTWRLPRCSCRRPRPPATRPPRAARRTLIRVLETVLRALHPITPFITEELWQTVAVVADRKKPDDGRRIVSAAYPQAQLDKLDEASEAWVARLKEAVGICRSLRSEMKLNPAERVPCW